MTENLNYFIFSQKTPDFNDNSNTQGFLVVNETKNDLMYENEKLITLIDSYSNLTNDNDSHDQKNNIIREIIKIIDTIPHINYSPFCAYWQVVGYSYNEYKNSKLSADEKYKKIQELTDLYIQNRHDLYKNIGYSDIVLQVCSDLASNKRNGKTGITNLEHIITPLNFKHSQNINEFNSNSFAYLLPDKGDKALFNQILTTNDIQFSFRDNRQNKYPDMLLKIINNFFIIEHKLTNGSGGVQNQEINEIITFIQQKEKNPNWHYISCLQGNAFFKLQSNIEEPKSKKQYDTIVKSLKDYEQNYFVNSAGLKELIKDYIKTLSSKD